MGKCGIEWFRIGQCIYRINGKNERSSSAVRSGQRAYVSGCLWDQSPQLCLDAILRSSHDIMSKDPRR